MAQWYYTQNGQQAGPVDEAQLRQMLSSGQVASSDLVWKDGMANWAPLSAVAEFAGTAAAVTPAAGYPSPQPAQPLPYGGYAAPRAQYGAASVPNYLVQSILVTVLCCMPLGVVAIVFAAQVNSKLAVGDYAGAVDASNKAKLFSWLGFGLGLVGVVFWFIAAFAGALAHH